MEEVLSSEERVCCKFLHFLQASLAAKLVLLAPPCEYKEVFDGNLLCAITLFLDVRHIAGDDPLVQKRLALSTSQYNKDQMIPVELPDSENRTLITSHGDRGNNYFICPRNGVSFYFDHFKHNASDIKNIDMHDEENLEPWRRSLEDNATQYVNEHFPNGSLSVYLTKASGENRIVLCIESDFSRHQSTGRWRSEWIIKVNGNSLQKEFMVHGVIKVQTHLYEEGNVQLISSKESDFVLNVSKPSDFAVDCVKRIKEIDCNYQMAVGNNFKTMSDTTFKALRRQLPLTKSKIDWDKIIAYQIGNELSRSPS